MWRCTISNEILWFFLIIHSVLGRTFFMLFCVFSCFLFVFYNSKEGDFNANFMIRNWNHQVFGFFICLLKKGIINYIILAVIYTKTTVLGIGSNFKSIFFHPIKHIFGSVKAPALFILLFSYFHPFLEFSNTGIVSFLYFTTLLRGEWPMPLFFISLLVTCES